jgi:hypothetical protein
MIDSESGLGTSRIYGIVEYPRPFWSRDGRERAAVITIPKCKKIRRAVLHARFWDGADFSGDSPVSINSQPVDVLDGEARHDLVYVKHEIDPAILTCGENIFATKCETKHHGLEVLLPGPALQIWCDD